MKKGIIFDLDGTLIDSLEDLANSTNRVLSRHQLKTHELSEYNYFIGNGMKKLIERAINPHLEYFDICIKEFYDDYENHCLDNTSIYEGIEELINHLYTEGYKLSVVTNKPHHIAYKIVKGMFPYQFTCIYGQSENYPAKPSAELVNKVLEEMHITKEECFYAGDSDVDVLTAKNAHMESIGVTWGFRGRAELENAGATYIVDHPEEIEDLLK